MTTARFLVRLTQPGKLRQKTVLFERELLELIRADLQTSLF